MIDMNKTLDIIVTHYKEPWETGEKFFQMLDLQRMVDWDQIGVIVINDGTENRLPCRCFTGRPYSVIQSSIEQSGVSAARNEGIRRSCAEWIMFCDFDDLFANVYALKVLMDILPAPNHDILWADFIAENDKGLSIRSRNNVFNHAKLYRRQYILDLGLWFNEDMCFNEDRLFNSLALLYADPARTGRINSPYPLYVWAYNPQSVTHSPERYVKNRIGIYRGNKILCEAYEKDASPEDFHAMCIRAMVDAYYTFNVRVLSPELEKLLPEIAEFYRAHKQDDFNVDGNTLQQIADQSHKDYLAGLYDGMDEGFLIREDISLADWLEGLK